MRPRSIDVRGGGLRIGDAEITRVEDYLGPGLPAKAMFPTLHDDMWQRHAGWLVPRFFDAAAGRLQTSFHSWLVTTPRHKILIDTCVGNHKDRPADPRFHMRNEPWLERLATAGAHPDDIDFVMCTHLHGDHVGWNTRLVDGRWEPTFRNARYLFKKSEFDRWDDRRADHVPRDLQRNVFGDSVLPVVEAGRAVLVEDGYTVDDLLTVEAAPGHTPGNATIRLRSAGAEALFSGDVMHHPIQLPYPSLCSIFDEDPAVGLATRTALLEDAAERGLLLLPSHFAAPFCCRVCPAAAGQGAFLPDWHGH